LSQVAFAVDIGGTAVKFGLVKADGTLLANGLVPTAAERRMAGVRAALREAVASLREAARERGLKPAFFGAGVPGTLFGPRGRIVTPSPSLPFMKGFELSAFLREEAGLPAVAENDATLAALAEFRLGSGRGAESLLLATVGTGLGGGIVVNGQLIRGRYGTAGEIGHGVFQPDGEPCGCGSRGCLEQYTASRALKRFYAEASGGSAIRIRDLIEKARAREAAALTAVGRAATNLGIGLVACATLIPVDVIAIGGGVSVLGPILIRPIRAAFDRHALPYVRKAVRIVPAMLGNHAGITGAGLLAFADLGRKTAASRRFTSPARIESRSAPRRN
jgi:glucokinase